MLRDEVLRYEQITGESAEHVPIIKIGAFLDGYDAAVKALKQEPYEKFESTKDHIYKLAGDYKCWDNRLTQDEALELCHILEQEPNTWSLDDAREDFMYDVYKTLESLPINDEANRIIDSFDRVTSGIRCDDAISRQQAIEKMQELEDEDIEAYGCAIPEGFDGESHTAMMMARDALKQEPCEDAISREKAKQFLYERIDRLNDDELYDIFSRIIDDMYNELEPYVPETNVGNKAESEE